MLIVNPKGEIAFLRRMQEKPCYPILEQTLFQVVPDLIKRIHNNTDIEKSYFDLLSLQEKQMACDIIIHKLPENGIMLQPWVNQETAKNINFTDFENVMMEEEYEIPGPDL